MLINPENAEEMAVEEMKQDTVKKSLPDFRNKGTITNILAESGKTNDEY